MAPDATSSTVSKVDDLITLGDGGSRDVAGRAIVIHARYAQKLTLLRVKI